MKTNFGNLTVELRKGDITKQQDLGAVVNAANAQLKRGGGVAGAIHKAAGPELEMECRPLAPIGPGDAVVTGGHNLPNDYVIHTLGPVYGKDKPEEELLAACYRNSLARAEEKEVSSVGFPAISTGAFGYPMEEAARVAFETIRNEAAGLKKVRLVRFVLFSSSDLELHQKVLQEFTS
jgi:O-acetyl-ADP-ribose deacetylase (regulator of RNase III)